MFDERTAFAFFDDSAGGGANSDNDAEARSAAFADHRAFNARSEFADPFNESG